MPQTHSATKALRKNLARRLMNDRWRRKLRESYYAVRDAVAAGDAKGAAEHLPKAESIIDRAARRRILHPNKAARRKSRLQRAVAAIKK